jgi:aspartyl-tRNA(Asn)/glutamyl-tRNA(Gln) amidotransferase subunit A
LFEFSSIGQYHNELKEGKITCVQAVEYYLDRIQSTRHLNAFIEVYATEALEKARQLDQKRNTENPIGRLHGVVIAIKDVICHKGHKLSASSAILKDFISIYSATAVERLLAEEAIIIGSCNCDEFAMGSTNENSVYGRVLNGFDETKVSGGSSGGSAVAVQARLCMIALGSDTGGSVRQPADFCGVIGMKPTYGRISRYGLIAYGSSFDQIGIFGTTVYDIALALEVMAGPDEYDSTVSFKKVEEYSRNIIKKNKYRIAFFSEALDHSSLDPEIGSSIKELTKKLQKEGHQVSAIQFDLLDYVVPAYYVITTAEASSNLSRYDGVRFGHRNVENEIDLTEFYRKTRSEGLGKEVQRRIMLGTFVLSAGYYDAYFTKAQQVRSLLTKKIQLVFNDFDFIIMPSSPTTAFAAGEKMDDPISMYLADIYTVTANLTGIPAISLPLFRHTNGMPFGLQIMSNRFNELHLLRFSNEMMQEQRAVPTKPG